MINRLLLLWLTCSILIPLGYATTKMGYSKKLGGELQLTVDNYLKHYKKEEKVSAVAMSVRLPNTENIHSYYAGRVSDKADAAKLNADNLFQIGSITKSFTSAIILQLEAEGKLNINQTVGDWLPQYPAWKKVTIKRLLNMTSGITGYDKTKTFTEGSYDGLYKHWTGEELVKLASPSAPFISNARWDYSNTNYILAGMIIEAATKHSFTEEIQNRLLSKYNLKNTFYSAGVYPKNVTNRVVHGYFYDKQKSEVVDITSDTASWAQEAGGIISDTPDVIRWVKILYSTTLYPKKQLQELTTIVAQSNGKMIAASSEQHPKGFGLGVGRYYFPKLGKSFWYYEGSTVGYRTAYIWKECNDIAIAVALNSKTSSEKSDHINDLLSIAYQRILAAYPQYACEDRASHIPAE